MLTHLSKGGIVAQVQFRKALKYSFEWLDESFPTPIHKQGKVEEVFNMEEIIWIFACSVQVQVDFFPQYFKNTLSILIVYRPGGGNQLLEVSPNYVKENIEWISKTKG